MVSVTAVDPMAEERNLGIGRFKFTRLGTTSPLTVFYHVGGTAKPGMPEYKTHLADYAVLPASITIPAEALKRSWKSNRLPMPNWNPRNGGSDSRRSPGLRHRNRQFPPP